MEVSADQSTVKLPGPNESLNYTQLAQEIVALSTKQRSDSIKEYGEASTMQEQVHQCKVKER
jgi:hypothetical protein